MSGTQQILEVSQNQLELIEAALHTQSKILNVQADAGGRGADERLSAVKILIAKLAQHRPPSAAATSKPLRYLGWF